MTTAATYDRRSIMTEAWSRTRAFMARNPNGRLVIAFASYLREAWVNEKSRLANVREAQRVAGLTVDQLRAEIDQIENSPTNGGTAPSTVHLRKTLTAKLAEESNAQKRAIIQDTSACVVTFTKADGSRRVMRVSAQHLRHHVKGDQASRSSRIASHTRAYRHTNLLPVWDSEAKAIKSVNLSTVTRIETPEQTHTY